MRREGRVVEGWSRFFLFLLFFLEDFQGGAGGGGGWLSRFGFGFGFGFYPLAFATPWRHLASVIGLVGVEGVEASSCRAVELWVGAGVEGRGRGGCDALE